MSFDNNYPNRKDHRKQYYDERAVNESVRNHGADMLACQHRLFNQTKIKAIAKAELNSFLNEGIGGA